MFPKNKTPRDDKYKDYVKTLDCCTCGEEPWGDYQSIPHHTSGNGTALKGSDYETIPLCNDHHTEYHSTEGGRTRFYEKHNLNLEELIKQTQAGYEGEINESNT